VGTTLNILLDVAPNARIGTEPEPAPVTLVTISRFKVDTEQCLRICEKGEVPGSGELRLHTGSKRGLPRDLGAPAFHIVNEP
jgi:hypothetical protein